MSDSIFFREANEAVTDELKKRYDGNSVIRTNLTNDIFYDQIQDTPQRKAYIRIYDEEGNLALASGNPDDIADTKKFTDASGREKNAFAFYGMDMQVGSTYGSLRSVSFEFEFTRRQPKVGDPIDSQFDEVFNYADQAFGIGKKICIQYGYLVPYGTSRQSNRSRAPLSDDFNPDVHQNPRKNQSGTQILYPVVRPPLRQTEIYGYVFTITRPEFKIEQNGRVIYKIDAIGAGNETFDRPLLRGGDAFLKFRLWHSLGDKIWAPLDQKINEIDDESPYFVANFDSDADEGRFVKVQSIVDFIDFDIQSHNRYFTGEGEEANYFGDSLDHCDGFHNKFMPQTGPAGQNGYKTPVVDLICERTDQGKQAAHAQYRNALGWVIFRFDNDDYVKSDYRIDADRVDNDVFSYYVTLQYLVWLFNNTMNPGLDPKSTDLQRFINLRKAKKQPTGNEVTMINRDQMLYRIKTHGSFVLSPGTLQASMKYPTGDQGGDTLSKFLGNDLFDAIPSTSKRIYLPSANPTQILFTYGNYNRDNLLTANYGCLQNKTNWWKLIGGSVLAVGGTIITAGLGSAAAIGGGVYLAATSGYTERTEIFCWTSNSKDADEQAKARFYESSIPSHTAFQDAFSMDGGKAHSISNMLINRDTIASIVDELGGLTKTTADTKEGAEAKADDAVPNTDNTQTEITAEKFFGKLFTIIKNCSGGALDLYLTPDPDEPSPFVSTLLIKNRNEPPPSQTVKFPIFERGDGSVVDLNISSKITKAQQLEAAVGTSANQADLEGINSKDQTGGDDQTKTTTEPKPGTPTFKTIDAAKDTLTKSAFSSDNADVLAGLNTKLVSGQSIAAATQTSMRLMNLTLGCRIQGIHGFKFGDGFTIANLPPFLKTDTGRTRIMFTVVNINQRIRGTDWTSEIKGIMRFVPSQKTVPLTYE